MEIGNGFGGHSSMSDVHVWMEIGNGLGGGSRKKEVGRFLESCADLGTYMSRLESRADFLTKSRSIVLIPASKAMRIPSRRRR